jgi:hypothetical protein
MVLRRIPRVPLAALETVRLTGNTIQQGEFTDVFSRGFSTNLQANKSQRSSSCSIHIHENEIIVGLYLLYEADQDSNHVASWHV